RGRESRFVPAARWRSSRTAAATGEKRRARRTGAFQRAQVVPAVFLQSGRRAGPACSGTALPACGQAGGRRGLSRADESFFQTVPPAPAHNESAVAAGIHPLGTG